MTETKETRFKKKVVQCGTSRIIRMREAQVGDTYWVLTDEELNLLRGK